MSEISVNSILDAIGGATTTINGFTPTVSNMAGRNRIINGDMRIDQRNNGASVTAGAFTYTVDRMATSNNTGTGTIAAQQSTLTGAKSLKITATAAVTALTTTLWARGVDHRIEAQNVYDLNSKTITISFKVETNWTGNLPISLFNSDFTKSYVVDRAVVSGINTVSATISLEAATVLTNGNGIGVTLMVGANNEATYRTATTNSWLAGFFACSTASTQWAKTTGNFINITDLQLEEGSVATPFERVDYGTSLIRCQRYYESGASKLYLNISPTLFALTTEYKVVKRAAATLVYSAPPGGGFAPPTSIEWNNVDGFTGNRNSTQEIAHAWTASAEL